MSRGFSLAKFVGELAAGR